MSDIHKFGRESEWGSSPPPSAVRLRGLVECHSVGGFDAPFALKRPALAGRFFARYCPSSATELFSMCRRIPGTIEPVFS